MNYRLKRLKKAKKIYFSMMYSPKNGKRVYNKKPSALRELLFCQKVFGVFLLFISASFIFFTFVFLNYIESSLIYDFIYYTLAPGVLFSFYYAFFGGLIFGLSLMLVLCFFGVSKKLVKFVDLASVVLVFFLSAAFFGGDYLSKLNSYESAIEQSLEADLVYLNDGISSYILRESEELNKFQVELNNYELNRVIEKTYEKFHLYNLRLYNVVEFYKQPELLDLAMIVKKDVEKRLDVIRGKLDKNKQFEYFKGTQFLIPPFLLSIVFALRLLKAVIEYKFMDKDYGLSIFLISSESLLISLTLLTSSVYLFFSILFHYFNYYCIYNCNELYNAYGSSFLALISFAFVFLFPVSLIHYWSCLNCNHKLEARKRVEYIKREKVERSAILTWLVFSYSIKVYIIYAIYFRLIVSDVTKALKRI
ncbi:hypothetical protein J8Z24_18240 [Pseudoalteromonas sp. SCSIO 43201]|uniref:hypothetical protein n=1 Tax=Pseudoalteromonas sp. SCSIO 43201 TaxID=2822842 RepID=UPI00207638C9|nr:hypothetical protein [Pseudoalteromonas sp. SCSIO 43201]USD30901.1 hypothetical protein J8Z24_18240 [Pseudoalteromonas sp. SCSIO 43201]